MNGKPARLMTFSGLGCLLLVLGTSPSPRAAEEPVNYDESKVPAYEMPDPLIFSDGDAVKGPSSWPRRRAEIFEMFEREMYGRAPERPPEMRFESSVEAGALGGVASRKSITIHFTDRPDGPKMEVLAYLPSRSESAVPIFVGLHLFDKKAEHPIPGKALRSVLKDSARLDVDPNIASLLAELPEEKTIEVILARGYGIATIDAAEFAPDSAEDYRKGVIGHFAMPGEGGDHWRAIGAWAWALSRSLDYFETDSEIDSRRVIAIGHSRMGKTALWAAARDERFAMAISNQSGCGGAALSKRRFGETLRAINNRFPHWFCENFKAYNGREDALPFDQHMLIALIAPRPAYIASAEDDRWADPRGEFLAARAAEPVYRLLGRSGLGADEMPPVNQPVGGTIAYHVRVGRHALTDYDWMQYLNFADRCYGLDNK